MGTFYVVAGEALDLPSLRWGERIETLSAGFVRGTGTRISPHSGGGSGLKLLSFGLWFPRSAGISPHSGGGSGLKL